MNATMSDLADRLRQLETENALLREALEKQSALERVALLESQLKERERDLQSILDHMPAMIGYWDTKLRNRFGNRAYRDWFGIDPARLPGMHIREVIGEERYRLNLPYIEGALRGEAQEFERAIPTPDGARVRHSLATYIPDRDDGAVRGFYVLVADITAIKEAEAALVAQGERLRASEERYRAVVEDQTEAISRFRADGTFLFVNAVYCRFFGKRAEELIGRQWIPVCYPDDVARVLEGLAAMTPTAPVVVIENRVFSGAGELRWMQFVNRGLYDDAGRLAEIQSVGRDITDRKNAEAALQEAHELLERRVVERTEQLRRLAVETTLAETRERQAIARDLHDGLGQLLHVAKIRLDTLADIQPDAAPVIAELDALHAEATRLVRSLTAQLSPPVLKRLGLAPALRWLADEMRHQYDLETDCAIADLPFPLSPAQAEILFRSARELLINVKKHAGVDAARLELAATADGLRLAVEDSGAGIPDLATLHTAAGFGLASLRERIAYLGGTTALSPGAAGGLRVELRLPIAAARQDEEQT